jgi:hypothetical protein
MFIVAAGGAYLIPLCRRGHRVFQEPLPDALDIGGKIQIAVHDTGENAGVPCINLAIP